MSTEMRSCSSNYLVLSLMWVSVSKCFWGIDWIFVAVVDSSLIPFTLLFFSFFFLSFAFILVSFCIHPLHRSHHIIQLTQCSLQLANGGIDFVCHPLNRVLFELSTNVDCQPVHRVQLNVKQDNITQQKFPNSKIVWLHATNEMVNQKGEHKSWKTKLEWWLQRQCEIKQKGKNIILFFPFFLLQNDWNCTERKETRQNGR